ncbi:MAG TPA: prepilin-type N-terminal cleavage/methylation domain-containing protein [Candidatus Methylacidiphilales bacterium]|nr:prepilin-type N-terminal cleavage/methylation domain-containing protein [Candidatus Methylacidiphilales bacterium]
MNQRFRYQKRGFTLTELLVVIGIIAILGFLAFPIGRMAILHAQCTGCASHMRTLGMAFMSFATDNNGQLPGRVEGDGNNKWPILLQPYVPDLSVYVDPGDPVAMKIPQDQFLSNGSNNSSFFFNGFNDLGAYNNPNITVGLVNLTDASNLILLGQKVHGITQYYMDFVEGNQNDILNKTAYFGGSNYVFADGSARFLYKSQYSDTMWLINQNYSIPPVPAGH